MTILFIDGENFKKKCRSILHANGVKEIRWDLFDFRNLLDAALANEKIDERRFYAAKLMRYPQTAAKSERLIQQQRLLKTGLERRGFQFLICGRVRGHEEHDPYSGRTLLVFREKGVDVRLAVDLITMTCDGNLQRAIIGSSDSDLQPAIREMANRHVETVYLGFASSPNKGLTYTTQRTILIPDVAVLRSHPTTSAS